MVLINFDKVSLMVFIIFIVTWPIQLFYLDLILDDNLFEESLVSREIREITVSYISSTSYLIFEDNKVLM